MQLLDKVYAYNGSHSCALRAMLDLCRQFKCFYASFGEESCRDRLVGCGTIEHCKADSPLKECERLHRLIERPMQFVGQLKDANVLACVQVKSTVNKLVISLVLEHFASVG